MTFLPRYASNVVAKEWSDDERRGLINAWIDQFAGAFKGCELSVWGVG